MRAILLLVLVIVCYAHAAKILFLFPAVARSHHNIGYSLAKDLASRDHEITFINPYAQEKIVKNLRNVVLEGFLEKAAEMHKEKNMFDFNDLPVFASIYVLGSFGLMLAEETLKNAATQSILNSDESFDLVITESFMMDSLQGIAHHYKVPSILLSAIGPSIWTNHIVGAPDMPSYMPHVNIDFHGNKMPFWKRVHNTIIFLLQKLYDHVYFYPKHNQLLRTYLPESADIYDLIYNTSLVFVNSHVSFNRPSSVSPNMIEIGGYHVDPPKALPNDLQKIIDESKNGVIYFSMGSNLKSSQLRPELKAAILTAFSKLKETILWKFEEDIPNKPPNVIIRSWFPQNDVLAHPNVKLFITHGGLLSTIETIYHGKPIIGIPVFGDQAMNIANAVNVGYAVEIALKQLSETTLSESVQEVLTNPKYTQIAKERSKILHDQQLKPRDKAAYWVDYVLRYKGAPHLKSPGLHLTACQYYMVDVILLLTFITIVLLGVFYMVIRWILGRNKPPKKSTKKKEKRT